MMTAHTFTKLLAGSWNGVSGLALCPAHDDRLPSLSLTDGSDGQLLAHCFAGCNFGSIIARLTELVGSHRPLEDPQTRNGVRDAQRPFGQSQEIRRTIAQRILDACARTQGTVVERYLRDNRGIANSNSENLRFHPALRHLEGKQLPAMVAAVESGSGVIGIHRTWLSPDGTKAAVTPVRAMLGQIAGGAVRLSDGPGGLIVAEGIETALSLRDAADSGVRVWAALSAPGVATLQLPPQPGELIIGADGDPPGQQAAEKLAGRASALGWDVRIASAPLGLDWNDVALAESKGQQ